MDPGAPLVRAHILDVIRDLLERYDVDGLHFDDYFYPYTIANTTFDDHASYAAYTCAGGTLARADWRRNTVDTLRARGPRRTVAPRPTGRELRHPLRSAYNGAGAARTRITQGSVGVCVDDTALPGKGA